MHAPFVESIEINPEDYGYELTEDDILVPAITYEDVTPDDFPVPCNLLVSHDKDRRFLKYAKKNRLSFLCETNKPQQIL